MPLNAENAEDTQRTAEKTDQLSDFCKALTQTFTKRTQLKMKKTFRISISFVLYAASILLASQQVALAQDHATKVQEVLTLAHKYRQFNGSALVAENGKVIYKGGLGLANMEWNIPNNSDKKFSLGSINKHIYTSLSPT